MQREQPSGSTPAAHPARAARSFSHNRYLQRLVSAYLLVWLLLAIRPLDRSDWLLENLVVFAAIGVLAATHRALPLSNLSHTLLAIFLALHAVGAHYTYSLTPVGDWVRDWLGLARNHYDRFVHFAFGLLLYYPLREVARRVLHIRGIWAHVVPLATLLALSSFYELLEGWTARIVDPGLGTAFLGTQGDEWDAQKDMGLALLGAVLAALATVLALRITGREPAWSHAEVGGTD